MRDAIILMLTVMLCTITCGAAAEGATAPATESDFPEKVILDRAAVVTRAAAVTAEQYPNADDVIVDERVLARYRPDGTAVYWSDKYVKVLTEKGRRNRRTISLQFNTHYSRVAAELVAVIKPDGAVTAIDVEKQARVMVDRSQMSSNIYNPDQKVLQVSVPGLEPGDILHHRVTYRNIKARMPNTWSDYNVWEGTAPILHVLYEIEAPAALPLRNRKLKHPVADTVSCTAEKLDNGNTLHRWEVRDVPRMYPEPSMPPLHTVVQHQIVSTLENWEEVSRWYWELCRPRLEATTPAMKEKVAALTKGAGSDREKVRRLFTFVSQNIRYMGITTEKTAPGYEPHDVRITFENRYGVCRDKAALLAAMLRLAGLKGYPVLIYAGPKKDPDVPQPYFNHAIVAVELAEDEFTLMDPTNESTARLLPEYLCDMSYIVAHPEGKTLQTSPIIPAEENLLRIDSTGAIGEDGTLTITVNLAFEGINDTVYRGHFARMKEEKRRQFFEQRIKSAVPGATLASFALRPKNLQNTDEQLAAEITFTAKDYLLTGDGLAMLRPPWVGRVLGTSNFLLRGTGLSKRTYPLDTQITCGVRETVRVDVSATGVAPLSLPEKAAGDKGCVSFRQEFTNEEGGIISGTSAFLLKDVEFSPAEYLALKQLLKDREYQQRRKPVFTLIPEYSTKPDIEILSRERRVDIAGPSRWKSTVCTRKKILTYAGKKANAEIRIDYNPAWETVTVEEATVVGTDGAAKNIKEEEMNLMDAAWAGGAPRYPAGKTLVLSLPGVDVGSIIETRITTESRDKPFFSLVDSFGGSDPVAERTLVVTAPAGMDLATRALAGRGRPAPSLETRTADERTIRTWTAADIPGYKDESNLPPAWSMAPAVLVSAGDLADYSETVFAALSGAAETDGNIKTRAAKIIAGADDDAARICALRDYVAINIRPAGPSLSRLPLSTVTPAPTTLADGYGNTADRAVVLYALLEAAGLKPAFILAWQSDPRVASLRAPLLNCPQRRLFDTVLIRVATKDGPVYLNDADQYAAPGTTPFAGKLGLAAGGKTVTIQPLPGREGRSLIEYAIQIRENGDARVTRTRTYCGTAFGSFHRRYAEMPPEERRRHHRRMLTALSQSAEPDGELVTKYDTYPGVERFTAMIHRFAVRDGKYCYFTLPRAMTGTLPADADTRSNPLLHPRRLRREVIYRVELPASVTAVRMVPDDLAWRGPAGLGRIESESGVDTSENGGPVITIRRRASLDPAVLPAARYAEVLEIDRRLAHPSARTITVELNE